MPHHGARGPDQLTIAIRADASAEIGGGHVMRCLTLARALERQGHDIAFFCRDGTREAAPQLGMAGFKVHGVSDDPAEWVAAVRDWQPAGVDLAIVDSYDADAVAERMMRGCAKRIMRSATASAS